MSDINTAVLAERIRSKRGNASLREIAAQIGDISIATLSRMEQGRETNTSNFYKVCDWLEISPEVFRTSSSEEVPEVDHKEEILYHLRADQELTREVSQALQKMIELAYRTQP